MRLPIEPPIEPMLAKPADSLPTDDGWLFEPKWDGFRAIVFRDGDELLIQSRDLKPLDRYFPELAEPLRSNLPERCVVDGEVVTGSHYRSYQRLDVTPAVPDEVKRFAERILADRSPAPVVVVDIGRSGDELFVVEFNGACSSGFYAADLSLWVAAVGRFVGS